MAIDADVHSAFSCRAMEPALDSKPSFGRRLATVLSLLLFLFAVNFHLVQPDPLLTSPAAMTESSTDDDGAPDAKQSVVDHCHCVVAMQVLAVIQLVRIDVRSVPVPAARALTTLHLSFDGPPPKT